MASVSKKWRKKQKGWPSEHPRRLRANFLSKTVVSGGRRRQKRDDSSKQLRPTFPNRVGKAAKTRPQKQKEMRGDLSKKAHPGRARRFAKDVIIAFKGRIRKQTGDDFSNQSRPSLANRAGKQRRNSSRGVLGSRRKKRRELTLRKSLALCAAWLKW